jgi:hypothetical protein
MQTLQNFAITAVDNHRAASKNQTLQAALERFRKSGNRFSDGADAPWASEAPRKEARQNKNLEAFRDSKKSGKTLGALAKEL